nr:hypothetical protein [Tanacetum cinerariifolium]
MHTTDSVETPMVEKSKLDEDLQWKPIDATLYCGMLGSLMYLTSSRPDLIYAVCLCAWYKAKPTEMDLQAVKRIFRYLKGPLIWDYGIRRISICHSQLMQMPIMRWSSKKQKSTAISSTEAEHIALSGCCSQILWMHSQLTGGVEEDSMVGLDIRNQKACSADNSCCGVKHFPKSLVSLFNFHSQ